MDRVCTRVSSKCLGAHRGTWNERGHGWRCLINDRRSTGKAEGLRLLLQAHGEELGMGDCVP